MSNAVLILGESGMGKSTSLRNLNPEKTLLIQALKKPLPFRNSNNVWTYKTKDNPEGNIYVTDNYEVICKAIKLTKKEIIVIDDFQAVMTNKFMSEVLNKANKDSIFHKYNEIGYQIWSVFEAATSAEAYKRIYILAHSTIDDNGITRMSTIGKLVDEKIKPESRVTEVLLASKINDEHRFITKNNGFTIVKTPMGMFEEGAIDNCLDLVDKTICEYHNINKNMEDITQEITD